MAYNTVKELFVAICDSIRAKKDTTEPIAHQDIPVEIEGVYESGYTKGVSDTLDTYPLGIEGTFVPERDTKVFEMSGLHFTPKSVMILCTSELPAGITRKSDNLYGACVQKGLYSYMMYTDSTGTSRNASVNPSSSILKWTENSVTLTIPSTITSKFNTGLVYNYYITGGVE